VSLPIQTDYAFELECDSLGNVKPVSFLKSSGVNQANFNINDNVLDIRLLTGESRDTSVKENIKSDVEITEDILRYRTPFWIYPTFLSMILIIIGLGYLASSQILGFLTKFKFW
jgi:glycosylphosphatidylinositol transamidase (GPIT) subunit GPI8